ncbi:unnamed protein product [Closterium sp. NIES-53]
MPHSRTSLPTSALAMLDTALPSQQSSLTGTRLRTETSVVAVGAARGTPCTPFFEGCSPSPLAPSYASTAAVDLLSSEDVGVAFVLCGKRRSSQGKGGKSGGGGSRGGGGGGGSGGGGGGGGGGTGGSGGGSGDFGGGGGDSGGGGGGGGGVSVSGGGGSGGGWGGAVQRGDSGAGQMLQQQRRSETPAPQHLREWFAQRTRLRIGACGGSVRPMPPNPGIEAAALGASESALPGTAPTEALHTVTLDSDASRCFFRDSTTLTPLPAPVPVTLADPSGGPILARSSTVLPCPAVPSGSLSGLHLPSFSTNLRAAPHSFSFTPSTAPLHTLPMDVWGPARISGQDREHFFLLVFYDYTRYTTVFPLRSKGEVPDVFIPWIRAVRLQLRERFREDLPVLRLHSDRGGEFSFDLFYEFCRGEGICQSFMLPASPQQNGVAEHRIGLVKEVGDASMFRVWGSRAFVRDTSTNKLSSRAIPCVFLGFPLDAHGWQFNHLTSRRVLSSQNITFDESVPFYLSAPSGVSQVDPLPGTVPVKVAVDSGAARGAAFGGATSGGTASGGAEPASAEPGGAKPEGVEPGGAESEGAESRGAVSEGAESGGSEPRVTASAGVPAAAGAGGSSAAVSGAGGAGGAGPGGARTRDPGTGGTGDGGTFAGGAGAGGTRAGVSGAGGTSAGGARAGGAGAGDPGARGARVGGTYAGGAGFGAFGARGTGAGGAGAGGAGAGDPGARGAGGGGAAASGLGAEGTVQRRPFFVPPQPSSLPPPDSILRQVLSLSSSTGLTPSLLCLPPYQSQPRLQPDSPFPAPSPYAEQSNSFSEHREPDSRPDSPLRAVRTGRRVPPPCPPPVPGTHIMALRPSSVPLRVSLPPPRASSLPAVLDPESYLARAVSPTVPRLLASVVIDPSFESTSASALVAELVDFAAACRLDYATSLVAESESGCPSSVRGECALGTDVLEDRQEDFECLAAAVPHLVAMLLAPEGDPDAPDIPTPRSYAEVITGTYIDAVLPPGANIVDGMWIFRGVDFFHTFSPTPKMTTLRVLLHVAAQRDYELHSLNFITAFLQGSLHEEIWLRRPPGFTRSFPAVTQWSLRWPVYSLRWPVSGRLRFGFRYSLLQSTPLPTGHSLSAPPSDESVELSGPYPELVGCLMYLMTCTRPDLAYPLSILARYVAPGRHGPEHWEAAKNASWVDDLATQRSSQGYTFSLGSGSVSWRSTHSSSVLDSSCEAEIYAGAMAAQELRWLTYLLTDLGERPRSSPVLYIDNKAMIALCLEHILEHWTKHIALRYFLARELE